MTLSFLLLSSLTIAAETPVKKPDAPKTPGAAKRVYPKNPTPTAANVRYGSAERNVFDLWQAKSDKTLPDGTTTLKQGEQLKLRHRFLFHCGDAASAKIEDAWQQYAKEVK